PHDREDSAPTMATSNAANTSPSGASSAIGGAIQGLQQNASGYLSQMGVAATGQGYLVTDAMSAALKNRLGLQTGDKVLSVNGQNVGQNPTQDAQLLRQVQQAGQAQIQVQRGDQVVTVRQSF
ncbi:MAG: PDZ domain-containing protein, partial [Moraxella osloensis]